MHEYKPVCRLGFHYALFLMREVGSVPCWEPVPLTAVLGLSTGSLPTNYELYYGFTRFAVELNELDPVLKDLLPPTDARFRPDQRSEWQQSFCWILDDNVGVRGHWDSSPSFVCSFIHSLFPVFAPKYLSSYSGQNSACRVIITEQYSMASCVGQEQKASTYLPNV